MSKRRKEKTYVANNTDKFLATVASKKNTHSARARRRKMERALKKYSKDE